MISNWEVIETNHMIEKENLDVRTITIGISLLDCIDSDLDKLNENIYNKITTVAKDLVKTGQEMCKYNLTEDYSDMTALIFGELYRHNGEWKFSAIGQGTKDTSLGELMKRYV